MTTKEKYGAWKARMKSLEKKNRYFKEAVLENNKMKFCKVCHKRVINVFSTMKDFHNICPCDYLLEDSRFEKFLMDHSSWTIRKLKKKKLPESGIPHMETQRIKFKGETQDGTAT